MATQETIKYIYDRLIKNGTTVEGACALLGNLEAESGFNPKNLQDTYNTSLKMTDEEYTKAVDNGTYKNFVRDSA